MNDKPDIVAVAQSYTALKKQGTEMVGLCPLHKEKSPSFYVNPGHQVYHCKGCDAGGDVYDLIMRGHGCDFRAAKEIIGQTDLPFINPVKIP